jgi:hypothetical protein
MDNTMTRRGIGISCSWKVDIEPGDAVDTIPVVGSREVPGKSTSRAVTYEQR